jgi:hypothetical protein
MVAIAWMPGMCIPGIGVGFFGILTVVASLLHSLGHAMMVTACRLQLQADRFAAMHSAGQVGQCCKLVISYFVKITCFQRTMADLQNPEEQNHVHCNSHTDRFQIGSFNVCRINNLLNNDISKPAVALVKMV